MTEQDEVYGPYEGIDPRDFLDEGEIHDDDDIIPFHRIHVDEWAEETEEEE